MTGIFPKILARVYLSKCTLGTRYAYEHEVSSMSQSINSN
jgi:hypothetical protein